MNSIPSRKDQSCSLDSPLAEPLLPLHGDSNQDIFDLPFVEEGPMLDDEYYSFPSLYRGSRSNVRRILSATWFGFTGRAIWSQTVLPILIYQSYPQQLERVGYVTAAMGASQVLGSVVTQYCLTPTWKRHELLQLASLTGLWSLLVLSDAVLFQVDWSWLVRGLCAWAFTWGIMDKAMPSLFADSLPETKETMYYTRASRLLRFGNTLGPALVFALFCFILNDEWTVLNCSIVVEFGLGFSLPMVFLLCCLHEVDDEDELAEELHFTDISQSERGHEPQGKMEVAGDVTEETAAISATLDMSLQSSVETSLSAPHSMVPPLLLVSCILSGAASGISIRYFPIFLVKDMELKPAFVHALYMIAPLGQALVKYGSKYMARCFGASCVTVALQWAFVGILLAMVYAYKQGMSAWIVSAAYLGHAFLMNSSTDLTQAILLSAISDSTRAKTWAVGETFQLLLWSAGAATGGYLVRTKGVLVPFQATAALQLAASIPIMFLCCTGPSRRQVNEILFPQRRDSIRWDNAVSTVDFDRNHRAMEEGRENSENSHQLNLDASSIPSLSAYYDCLLVTTHD